ncbi:MAG TPA: alanine racemase [Pyrinomonadaceae bacterium]|nr:alanine racemase [Pyrinomonadaceae bacterium]
MSEQYTKRPTWAKIDLDNLAFNFHSVKKFVGQNLRYMAVVKADAYGHNSIQCARRLETEGIDWFGVALPEEGVELRNSGIRKLILCLGSFWFGQEKLLLNNNLTPVIYQIEKARSFNQTAKERGTIADIHIKIDTGMGRIGIRFDEVKEFAEKLKDFKYIRVNGLMTHFAAADNLNENSFTDLQINRFKEAVAIFENKGFRPVYKDLANSPGAIVHENSRENMVRLGGVLYGLGDDVLPKEVKKPELKPVMSVSTQIAHLKKVPKGETIGYSRTFKTQKDSLIATIPIGYQDGLPRLLSNKGRVLINGQFAPIVGRISMDWTIVNVTDIPNVKLEDEVVIIGENNGLRITAEELAQKSETISYEITCGINRRVTRNYVGGK